MISSSLIVARHSIARHSIVLHSILLGSITLALAAPLSAQSWQEVFLPGGVTAASMAFDPTDSDHVVALQGAFGAQVLFESYDAGASWVDLPVPTVVAEFQTVNEVAFQHDGRLFLAGDTGYPSAGEALAVRRDFSGQWQAGGPTAPMGGFFDVRVESVVSSPSGLIAMGVVATDKAFYWNNSIVYFSTDDGATWDSTSALGWQLGKLTNLALCSPPGAPECLLYSIEDTVFNAGVDQYRYELGGVPQTISFQGARAIAAPGRVMGNVVYATPGVAADPFSMRRSEDGGQTWSPLPNSGTQTISLLRGHVDPDLLVRRSGSSEISVSRDGGQSWSALPSASTGNEFLLALASDDSRVFVQLLGRHVYLDLRASVGAVECTSMPGGSGVTAALELQGSASVSDGDLLLWSSGMLRNGFGLFIGSQTPANLPGAGGSFGTLCLGGAISRIGQPGLANGATGEFSYRLDLNALPTPTGLVTVQPGQTWRFQAWFRDRVQGVNGSNFSDALSVTFTP